MRGTVDYYPKHDQQETKIIACDPDGGQKRMGSGLGIGKKEKIPPPPPPAPAAGKEVPNTILL